MKKIILSVGALCTMSFTSHQVYQQYKLGEAIGHIQDMKEWMMQDVEHGKIDQKLAEDYMYWLEVTENELIEFANNNRITTPDPECMGYEVLEDGSVSNFKY
jgi:hypothetical protein